MSEASHLRAANRLGALRYPAFRALLGAGMAMQLGTWIQRIALLWVVFQITGSAVQLAGLGFVSGIFVLLISPFAGPLADSVGARRVLMGAAVGQAIAAAIVAATVLAGIESVPLLYFLATAQGVGNSLSQPMRNLLVYDAVGRDLLRNGLALNSITGNMMRVIGPSIGGAIVATRGADLAFAVQAVLLIAAVGLVAGLRVESTRSLVRAGVWSELRSGFAYVRGHRTVRVNIVMAVISSALVYPYMQFLPVVVVEQVGGAARELGFLQSAAGVGSLIGLWYVVSGRGGTTTMLWTAFVYMTLVAAFAQFASLELAFATLVIAGIAHSIYSTLNQALVQLNTEDQYRARVMGLYAMSGGLEPFGTMLLGALVQALGVSYAIGGFAGLAAVIAFVFAVTTTVGASRRPSRAPAEQ
ncbi:MAG: MFS transporter [Chloroflexi bacterium]|nr:MFS transporter [Chloroflexota bacterium]MDA1003792.1 MFS transporter [Chloroflexota bacterium]